MTENLNAGRQKILQMRMTDEELALVRDAARRADMTVSDYGRKRLLAAVLDKRNMGDADRLAELLQERRRQDAGAVAAVENFQRIFVAAMELNLAGKLTVPRLRGLVERRSA